MENNRTEKPKIASLIISAVFVLTLLAFGIGIFLFQREVSETENRVLTTLPKPNAADILSGEWQSSFEEFTSDQFPFRDGFTSLGASVRYALGMRELGGVTVGHTSDGGIRLFETLTPDSERGDRIASTLSALEKFASSMGNAETVLMPVPSSGLIYGEDLPSLASADDIEELYTSVTEKSESYTVLPTLSILRDAKDTDKEALYFRTDHHWTARGAQAAYVSLCGLLGLSPETAGFETLSAEFYGTLFSKALLPFITPDTVEKSTLAAESIRVKAGGGYGGIENLTEIPLYHDDRLDVKDKYEYFLGGNYGLVVIENQALPDDAPTLFVFKDSFANIMAPYLASSFRRVVMVDPRYYRGTASDLRSLIESESPSTVLILYEIMTLADDTSLRPLLERVTG